MMSHLQKLLIGCLFYVPSFLHAQVGSELASIPSTSTSTKSFVDALTSYGILDEKDDWCSQITSTNPCNGETAANLIMQLARSYRNVNTLSGAVSLLNDYSIIMATEMDYWLNNAIAGGQCDFASIKGLLKRMVVKLPIRLTPPSSIHATPLQPIQAADVNKQYDVVVAGAGSGGCGVAIQAARMGCSVLLLEETDWIGGQITAAGVSTMDEGSALVQGRGLYRELCGHIVAHYQPLGIDPVHPYGRYCVEPSVAHQILYRLLGDAAGKTKNIDLLLCTTVKRVFKNGDCITGVEITTTHEEVLKTQKVFSKIVVDATEWGDLIPLTGARYRVGNCISDALNMKSRIQSLTWTATLKQYPQGVPSELYVTNPPPGYSRVLNHFQLSLHLGRAEDFSKKSPWSWEKFIGYRAMPDARNAGNNHAITLTGLNFNNDQPVTVGDVENLDQRHISRYTALNKTLNLLYYIQSNLKQTDWAIANDQGYDTPYQREQIDAITTLYPDLKPYRPILYHFSVIPYVRESRRIIGLHTLTAREIVRYPGHPIQFPHTVALGDYYVDLHGSALPKDIELDLDRVQDIPAHFGASGVGPFAIPFECFIPEKIDGFLPAEKNFSQSRLVNGATRLQPHTLLMGQAVGAIAALSIQQGVQPRLLNPLCVQQVLLDAGCTLSVQLPKSAWGSPEWKQENLRALYPNNLTME